MEEYFGPNEGPELIPETIKDDKPSIKQVSILYAVTVILFVFAGSRVQARELYSGLLITEFLIVMLPGLVLIWAKGYDFKYVLRLNSISFSNLLIIFGMMLFTIPVIGVFNIINMSVIERVFGKVIINSPPIDTDPSGLMIGILVIAVSAGICEEVLFRGVIQRGFERMGATASILISGFLFGLMHVDFQKLLGTFLLGCMIGFIVYRTNSIFAGILAHFSNNAIALVLSYLSAQYMAAVESQGADGGGALSPGSEFNSIFEMPQSQLLAVIIFYGMFFIISTGILILLFRAFLKNTRGKAEMMGDMRQKGDITGLLWLLPPVLLIAFIYVNQGYDLMGKDTIVLKKIIGIIGFKV